MPEEITQQPSPELSTPDITDNIAGQDAGNIAPNIDSELDAALSKTFEKKASNEPKEEKSIVQPEKTSKKEVDTKKSKETPKAEIKQQGELPKPEAVAEGNPKGQEAWTALKNNYKQAHKMISEREEENTRLKKALAEKATVTTKEVEELKNEIKELSKYRSMVDTQADPEFISKYDEPIEKSKGNLKDMLLGMGVDKNVVDQVDFTNTKLMSQIIKYVAENQDDLTADELRYKIKDHVDLMKKRSMTLVDQKKNYEQYLESKKKESSLKGAEDEGRIYQRISSVAGMKDPAGNTSFPFLNKITVSDSASQPEIDQANNHNRVVDLMQQKLNQAIKMTSPEEKADLAIAAVASHYLTAQLRALSSENNSLKEEIAKISNVSGESDKTKSKTVSRSSNGQQVDVDSALSNFFSR